jgi:hypothetical protein
MVSTGYEGPQECGVCNDGFSSKDPAVTHDGEGGKKHLPLHEGCFKAWAKKNPSCMFCRAPIDLSSVFSWTERLKDAAKQGAVYAVGSALLYSTPMGGMKLAPELIKMIIPDLESAGNLGEQLLLSSSYLGAFILTLPVGGFVLKSGMSPRAILAGFVGLIIHELSMGPTPFPEMSYSNIAMISLASGVASGVFAAAKRWWS